MAPVVHRNQCASPYGPSLSRVAHWPPPAPGGGLDLGASQSPPSATTPRGVVPGVEGRQRIGEPQAISIATPPPCRGGARTRRRQPAPTGPTDSPFEKGADLPARLHTAPSNLPKANSEQCNTELYRSPTVPSKLQPASSHKNSPVMLSPLRPAMGSPVDRPCELRTTGASPPTMRPRVAALRQQDLHCRRRRLDEEAVWAAPQRLDGHEVSHASVARPGGGGLGSPGAFPSCGRSESRRGL